MVFRSADLLAVLLSVSPTASASCMVNDEDVAPPCAWLSLRLAVTAFRQRKRQLNKLVGVGVSI